jgi:hypothetical protein
MRPRAYSAVDSFKKPRPLGTQSSSPIFLRDARGLTMVNLSLLLTGSFALGFACTSVARAVARRAGYIDYGAGRRKLRPRSDLRFQFEVRSDRFWVGVAFQRRYSGRQVILNLVPCFSLVWSW